MRKIICIIIISILLLSACQAPSTNVPDAEDIKPTEKSNETETEVISETQTVETEEKQEEEEVEEEMAKSNLIAVVVARDRYQSLEFNPVVDALAAAGYDLIIASDELGTAKGTTEDTEVDIAFKDITAEDLLGIVLIGGSNSLWNNAELHKVLNEVNDAGKLTAAICYGSVTLAKAHVIGEGDIACWYNSPESDPEMENEGIVDSAQDVTVQGNIITGDGPNAAEEFAKALVDYLG